MSFFKSVRQIPRHFDQFGAIAQQGNTAALYGASAYGNFRPRAFHS